MAIFDMPDIISLFLAVKNQQPPGMKTERRFGIHEDKQYCAEGEARFGRNLADYTALIRPTG